MSLPSAFESFHPLFRSITGPEPALELLLERDYPFAFEAGIYKPAANELFITSSPFDAPDGNIIFQDGTRKTVHISRITFREEGDNIVATSQEVLPNGSVHMANGGTNFGDDDAEVLFCAQGSKTTASGIYAMATTSPYASRPLVTSFYSRPFNSVNDVVVHPKDGSIWFTDPAYGFHEGYRPSARLPNQVYRFDPGSESVRVLADGFGHPNGICFSPDASMVYVTDTDYVWGDGTVDETRASTIYVFDVVQHAGQPFMQNRRVFAMADVGFPDGIKCDTQGNVYSGCGDGVHIWSPGGVLLGKIRVPDDMVANLCFGRPGELFLLNGKCLWRARLPKSIQGSQLSGHRNGNHRHEVCNSRI